MQSDLYHCQCWKDGIIYGGGNCGQRYGEVHHSDLTGVDDGFCPMCNNEVQCWCRDQGFVDWMPRHIITTVWAKGQAGRLRS